jgi:hypothetical protein
MSTTYSETGFGLEATAESGDVPYRTLSQSAVVSAALGGLSLLGFWLAPLLVLAFLAILFGLLGLRAIKKLPMELTGRSLAWAGLSLGCITMLGGAGYHSWIYATEVPPGYDRIAFSILKSAKGQPDVPPTAALELDGQRVFVKGYVHPTSVSSPRSRRFVLVPDLGTCCFGGQPPLTHMIEVALDGEEYVSRSLRQWRLAGTLHVDQRLTPITGLEGVYYRLDADYIK